MAEAASAAGGAGKVVIKNIGLLLSGDLARPILDADAIVAVDGRIAAVGRFKDLDTAGAKTTVDAKGTALAPGLIDSHVHPVAGDWTPRQNQIGWIDSYLHGGITTMISAGEVHTPGRPRDVVGLKAMAIFAQRAFSADHQPCGASHGFDRRGHENKAQHSRDCKHSVRRRRGVPAGRSAGFL